MLVGMVRRMFLKALSAVGFGSVLKYYNFDSSEQRRTCPIDLEVSSKNKNTDLYKLEKWIAETGTWQKVRMYELRVNDIFRMDNDDVDIRIRCWKVEVDPWYRDDIGMWTVRSISTNKPH